MRLSRRVVGKATTIALATLALSACYPKYDWRDVRPDCARGWCGFVATFPGKATSATRDIPVGATSLPLAANVVSVGDVSFAVLAFELGTGGDAAAARATLEKKFLDDVGAADGRRRPVAIAVADRGTIDGDALEASGERDRRAFAGSARFALRRGRVVEIFVVGPAEVLAADEGRQAVETFLTSLRLD